MEELKKFNARRKLKVRFTTHTSECCMSSGIFEMNLSDSSFNSTYNHLAYTLNISFNGDVANIKISGWLTLTSALTLFG